MEALQKKYAELLQAVLGGDRSKVAQLVEVKQQLMAASKPSQPEAAPAPTPVAEEAPAALAPAEESKEEAKAEPEAQKSKKNKKK